jgi:hypothetical protein
VKRVSHHLLIAVAVYVLTFFTNVPDLDLWARLAVGSIFFQTGHVLHHDVFSYLPTKDLWIDHEWGAGVVFYCFAKYFGEYGIFLLKALLIYSIFVMVVKAIKVRDSRRSPSVLFYAFLGYALFPGIASLVRSQMFTYLFFTVWIYGLERVKLRASLTSPDRGRRNPAEQPQASPKGEMLKEFDPAPTKQAAPPCTGSRRGELLKRALEEGKSLWLFPCTMLLWVNTHGGFLAGIGLVSLYIFGELLNRKSPLPYLWVILSILPIMLINPYGLALWRFVIDAALMPRPLIPEWHPISFSGPMESIAGIHVHYLAGYMILVALTLLAACRSLMREHKTEWTRVVVIVALFFLSIRHQRQAVFFVLAASTLWYEPIIGLLDPLRKLLSKFVPGNSAKIQRGALWGLGYALPAVIFLSILPRLSHRMTVDHRRYPVGSLEFIRRNGLSGNLATTFDWGSYAFWKLYPQCKVMIDGRYEEVYPSDVFDLAIRFSERKDNWWEVLSRFPTDIIVLSKNVYTQEDLARFRGWKPVYQDFVSVVLIPRDGSTKTYVHPDFRKPAYSREDLSKRIVALQGSGR